MEGKKIYEVRYEVGHESDSEDDEPLIITHNFNIPDGVEPRKVAEAYAERMTGKYHLHNILPEEIVGKRDIDSDAQLFNFKILSIKQIEEAADADVEGLESRVA